MKTGSSSGPGSYPYRAYWLPLGGRQCWHAGEANSMYHQAGSRLDASTHPSTPISSTLTGHHSILPAELASPVSVTKVPGSSSARTTAVGDGPPLKDVAVVTRAIFLGFNDGAARPSAT